MDFLVDRSGNRRFIPLALLDINKQFKMDDNFLMLLWGEIYSEYASKDSAQWWANDELKQMLVERHDRHQETSAVSELLSEIFDMQKLRPEFANHYTVTRALGACGISNPTKAQLKEAKSFIEKCGFASSQYKGTRGYYLERQPNV